MRIRLQKVKYARRNAITTPKDKLRAEEYEYDSKKYVVHGGTQLQLQEINFAWSNANTTEDKLCAEERNYDSRR